MRRALLATVAAAALVLAACGSAGPQVSAGAARLLHADIAALRSAAASHDRAATIAATDRIDLLVARLRATNAIDGAATERLRQALAQVRTRITLLPLPTTTTTTTTTPPEHGGGRDRGHGNGRPKGRSEDG